MTHALANPYALGATDVVTTTRTDRLSLGATFRPASAALAAVSGFLAGPGGTQGELTLLTDALLRVNPFTAVVQGTRSRVQGQYVVTSGQQVDLAVPAKDASQARRALIVVRVGDSLEAGVASSPTTDGAWLEIVPGSLAASNPVLPSTPPDSFAAGELTIPSAASGQPVTLTRYNPRTTMRGGILPVLAGPTITTPGYEGAPGTYRGEYRDHPTNGPERWTGDTWERVRIGEWVLTLDSATYSYALPVSGTPAALPSVTTGAVTIPVGRSMDVELDMPVLDMQSVAAGWIRLICVETAQIIGGMYVNNGAAARNAPSGRIVGTVAGAGAARTVVGQGWASAGAIVLGGTAAAGVGLRLRYRIT